MSRLGIFGGTFDPVHVGHLAIASAALESVPLDRVLFVPAKRSPLKDRLPLASEADRLTMLEAAIAGEPRFSVSRAELEREGPSYTADTLERLAGRVEQDQLFLILGGDAVVDFERWHRPDRIVQLATLLVAARPGAPDPVEGERRLVFDAPRLDISSRELRARALRGRSLRYLVPDAVWRHIEEHGLYRAMETTPRTT
ncbi:MAG: nicotinate (nicotinamide) nucleotide adenylyltransferase [Chloroflexi bacterium]|nr:nicotinate (nicotinamide) nucleotide adenylyltransferase [Chloroflexota bacterium]